jgi:hypothetical protein
MTGANDLQRINLPHTMAGLFTRGLRDMQRNATVLV